MIEHRELVGAGESLGKGWCGYRMRRINRYERAVAGIRRQVRTNRATPRLVGGRPGRDTRSGGLVDAFVGVGVGVRRAGQHRV